MGNDYELSTIIIEVKKLRPKEIRQFASGHPARKLQSPDLDPGSLVRKPPDSQFWLIQLQWASASPEGLKAQIAGSTPRNSDSVSGMGF